MATVSPISGASWTARSVHFAGWLPRPGALGEFQPAGDLDGDGLADVLSNDLASPEDSDAIRTDSRTVIARSGRDGRMLWRTPLDSWDDWFNWSSWTRASTITPLTLPAGDLNGDGVPDLLVQRSIGGLPINTERVAGLGLRALSGRSGHELWSSGPLPYVALTSYGNAQVTAITAYPSDHRGGPDLYVSHRLFIQAGLGASQGQPRMARVSGRDGRVVWDVLLADIPGGTGLHVGSRHRCADLDGDGALELVLLLESYGATGTDPEELRVLSVATGETRWSHPLDARADGPTAFAVGDLEGDGRSEVVVCEQVSSSSESLNRISVLDSTTGRPRRIWNGPSIPDVTGQRPALCLADFDGGGRRVICVSCRVAGGIRRIQIVQRRW